MTSKTKKRVLWIALPLVVVMGTGAAVAGYKQYGGHHNPERMVQRISEKLDLNDDQKSKLGAVKDALIEGKKAFRQERTEAIDEVIAEVKKSEMDESRIMELIEERTSKIDVIAPGVVAPLVEFHKSLDDGQREKIVNLLEAMRDWGWGHRGRHG